MIIQGLQKLTLLDYPEKVACIVFCAGCNFRCPFCHNAPLVVGTQGAVNISEDEVLDFLRKRKGILDGVVVTGGEPLLQPDIENFIIKIKDLGYLVKLDTNGSLPDKLESLITQHLVDYVAMDIKNSKEKYSGSSGVNVDIRKVSRSVELLLQNKVDYEFRTTVVKELHNDDDFLKIGEWIKGAKKYCLQCFEESVNVIRANYFTPPSNSDLKRFESIVAPFVEQTVIRGV